MQFQNAASIGAEESENGMAEFLILTELCTGNIQSNISVTLCMITLILSVL